MSNKFNAAANAIADEEFESAIDLLLSLLDGVDGDPTPPDWLVDSPEKDEIRGIIEDLLGLFPPL